MAYYPLYQQAYGLYGSVPPPPRPAAPVLQSNPATTSSTITPNWTGPAGSYALQRAPVSGAGVVGAFAPIYTGTTASYTDSALTFNTTYAYRVKVTVSGVDSAYSAVLQATTAAGGGSPFISDFKETI